MNDHSVAIHGTGFIGLVSACCLSVRGIKTCNSTFDEVKCNMINRGSPPFFENGLEELLGKALETGRYSCVLGRDTAVRGSDISMIAVGTPMREDHSIDLRFIESTARQLGQAIKSKDSYHLVVVRSTVVPGTTRNLVGRLIEEESGKKMGKDFGLCMQPEFLAEGRSIKDTFEPDRIVIGELDTRSGDMLEELYREFYGDHLETCPLIRMNLESAELVKYGNNCLLATKISFANEIARIAELVPYVDIVEVMKAVGLDYRINGRFLGAGVGFGGSCFPKDVNAIKAFAESKGYNPRILSAVLEVNAEQARHVVGLLEEVLPDLRDKRIVLLGLSFKPGTDDMRYAPSIRIAHQLLNRGATVVGYDPIAEEEAKKVFGDSILYAGTIEDALQGADAGIVVTEWEGIKRLSPDTVRENMKNPVIIDGRRVFKPMDFGDGVIVKRIGLNADTE